MIAQYKNGNTIVSIFKDGTKIRKWDGIPVPEFPESIDLKITDYCDAGCQWCHEKSTIKGIHGNYEFIKSLITGLPGGVELAIGGGNPLDFPQLNELLKFNKELGLISNLTVNSIHVKKYKKIIARLTGNFHSNKRLVYGLGISYNRKYKEDITALCHENKVNMDDIVVHYIAGVHRPEDLAELDFLKSLILGYKNFGFGKVYNSPEVEKKISVWRYWIGTLISKKNSSIVSFDNLGLEQLNVKDIVSKEIWDKKYMGDDGTFTMYIDAVRQEFAPTSTGKRIPCGDLTIKEMFKIVRQIRQGA